MQSSSSAGSIISCAHCTMQMPDFDGASLAKRRQKGSCMYVLMMLKCCSSWEYGDRCKTACFKNRLTFIFMPGTVGLQHVLEMVAGIYTIHSSVSYTSLFLVKLHEKKT